MGKAAGNSRVKQSEIHGIRSRQFMGKAAGNSWVKRLAIHG